MSDDGPTPSHSFVLTTYTTPESSPESSRDPSLCVPPSSSDTCTVRSSPELLSVPSQTSIKFAPLPEVERRTRHPSFQYGIGVRSRVLRHRHSTPAFSSNLPVLPADSQLRASPRTPVVHEPTQVIVTERHEGPIDEDPVVVLGRKLKGASKSLWRKMSKPARDKEKGKDVHPDSPLEEKQRLEEEEEGTREGTRESVEKSAEDVGELEGRVWEEEISADFRERFSVVRPATTDDDSKGDLSGPALDVKKDEPNNFLKRVSVMHTLSRTNTPPITAR